MPALLVADLSALTGEQLYHLIRRFDRWISLVCAAGAGSGMPEADVQALNRFVLELIELRDDALIQIGRITVPLAEAQAIIQRALISRNRPVRVSPTT